MSDLPTRSEMSDYLRGNFEGYSKEKHDWLLAVGWGYADGELLTRAEWEATIDKEAALDYLGRRRDGNMDDVTLTEGIVNAALRVGEETPCPTCGHLHYGTGHVGFGEETT